MARRSHPPEIAIFGAFDKDEVKSAHKQAAAASREADELLREMREIMGQFDQIHMLSRLAFIMILGIQPFGKPAFNPMIQPYELELLQALALSTCRSTTIEPMPMELAIDRLVKLVNQHSLAMRKIPLSVLSEHDGQRNKIEAVLDRMRTTTHTVRGPRHAYQTRAYVRALADDMDPRFLERFGFTVSDVADLMDRIAFQAAATLEGLRDKAMRWLLAAEPTRMLALFLKDSPHFCEHPIIGHLVGRDMPLDQVRSVLFAVFQQQLPPAFKLEWSTDNPRLTKLRDHLSAISLNFGDVGNDALAHLKLSNPVRMRPFVAVGGADFYLFCTQTCFANLVELIDDISEADSVLKEASETFKARWLEAKLNHLVREAFPSGVTFANAKWNDTEGKSGETDCILSIDKTIGLFEAKSGRITAPARRGAKDRLKREINTLLVRPSRQSARLAHLLRSRTGPVALKLPQGDAEIAGSEVREIIRFNILFDTLGPLTAGTTRLVEAGFIDSSEPMAPSMSIFELETLFDILPDQISRLHYLRRRMELEREALFEADEMDLIAFYLESNFNIAHLGNMEHGFSIYGWSDRIAATYDESGRRDKSVKMLKRTPFWQSLLTQLETRGQSGWTRFGFRLSSVPYRDQWSVQKRRDEIAKRARRVNPGQAVHSGVHDADGNSRTAIGLCVGKSVSDFGIQAHSRTAGVSIASSAGADEGLVLYWDIADKACDLRFIASFRIDESSDMRRQGTGSLLWT